jgi:hypothetical protein
MTDTPDMNAQNAPLLRSPRRIRKAGAYLRNRLEPGEEVQSALRVLTGSFLLYLLASAVIVAVYFLAVATLSGNPNEDPTFSIAVLGLIVIMGFAQWAILKPRLLVLTDRRMFVVKTTAVMDRPKEIEAVERRDDVHAELVDRDRVLVSGQRRRPISLRVPFGQRKIASYIRDWANSPR